MKSLAMRRERRSGIPRRSITPPHGARLVHRSMRCAALIVFAALVSSEVLAQRSPVAVDLGALDALGPAPANQEPNAGNRIRLHPPTRPVEPKTSTQSVAKPAAAKASIPRVGPAAIEAKAAPPGSGAPAATAGGSSSAAPSQANLAPGGAVLPPAPSAVPVVNVPGEIAEHILFPPDDAQLPGDAKAELDRLAARLSGDSRLYVQLVAYAGGSNDASQARRLSLTRALAARAYLVERGIDIKQIDVRPLGNRSVPGLSPDRVDLIVAQR